MLFLYLFVWLIIFMEISIAVTAAGVIISFAVYKFACVHMRYNQATNRKMLRNFFRGLKYALTLVWQTVKANIMVFRIVFSRNIEIQPRLIYFRTNLKTNIARVALANSITLTPGTITVALNENQFCVHCLNSKFAEGIEDSVFVRQLQKFED